MIGPEADSGNAAAVEAGGKFVRIDPGAAGVFKGPAGPDADVDPVQAPEDAVGGVIKRAFGSGDVGTGGDPAQAGIAPDHGALPAAHGDDAEPGPGFDPAIRIDHFCQFPGGHPVDVGYGNLTDKGFPFGIERRTGDPHAPERIGPVQHHEFLALLRTRFHGEGHGADVSIAAAADILKIEHHHVDVGQHRGRGLAGFPVEAVGWETGDGIAAGSDVNAGLFLAVQTVLRGIKRGEIPPQRPLQHHAGRRAIPGRTGLVQDQADPFAPQAGKTRVGQSVDPQGKWPTDSREGAQGGGGWQKCRAKSGGGDTQEGTAGSHGKKELGGGRSN